MNICPAGHKFYKTSDCPVCPLCEKSNKPVSGFLNELAAPARRALINAGIDSAKKLASWSEAEILSLHGIGPASIPALKKKLSEAGMKFKE